MTNNEIIQTLKDAIDLISRQQAEIENLKAHLKKVCAERDARICTNNFIKSEAVKEFQKRLKAIYTDELITDDMHCPVAVIKANIDDIAEEMISKAESEKEARK